MRTMGTRYFIVDCRPGRNKDLRAALELLQYHVSDTVLRVLELKEDQFRFLEISRLLAHEDEIICLKHQGRTPDPEP